MVPAHLPDREMDAVEDDTGADAEAAGGDVSGDAAGAGEGAAVAGSGADATGAGAFGEHATTDAAAIAAAKTCSQFM